MAMPAPSSPQPYYAPRRSNGCLWGCLIVILLLSLPVVLAGGYGAWFVWDGYRRDPVLRVVGELVREDGMAQMVLGHGAAITGVDANSFSWMPGLARNDYDVTLQGPKGEGHLSVTAHTGSSGPQLDTAILTGPDGRRYDLMKHMALPPDGNAPPDTSI
jgi:hypothetical protein